MRLPFDFGLRSANGSGFAITCPDALEILTLLPSSKYLREILVGLLLWESVRN